MFVQRITKLENLEKNLEKKLRTALKKHLLGILLAAAIYSPQALLTFLNERNFLNSTLGELTTNFADFKHEYERKLFIGGLARLCQVAPSWPEQVQPSIINVIKSLLDRLKYHEKVVAEELRTVAKEEMKVNDDEDEDDDDEDFETDED